MEDLDDDVCRESVDGAKTLPREELPEHDTHPVEIGATVGAAIELLGSHIAKLPLDRADDGRLGAPRRPCDTEIGETSDPIDADQDVVRGHVTMNDLEPDPIVTRGFVSRVQPGKQVARDRDDDVEWKARPLLRGSGGHGREVHSFDPLHDQERALAALRDEVDHLDDVLVADTRNEARFVGQRRGARGIVGHEIVQTLDRNETRRPVLIRPAEVDRRHSANACGTNALVAHVVRYCRG
jgi:hypothetical protein